MKTQFRTLAIIVLSTILVSGCDEETVDLLKNLTSGKMVVIVNDGEEILMDCTFGQYGGSGGFTGEVFINGMNAASTVQHQQFGIMYGSYNNTIPFEARTYKSDGVEAEGIHVHCWAGYASDEAVMTVRIISVSETSIKGEFDGEVMNNENVKSTVKGAFWATRAEQ